MTIDLSEKQFAECIRDRLVRQLIAANEQLEQFATIASHDLREPLRIIACFSDLLEKEYGDCLDGTGRSYLQISRQTAKKMEAMVTDLLEYGRIGENVERLQETDCNEALRHALVGLGEAIKTSKAKIQSDSLPTVFANSLQLSRLFLNLVGNAIKYRQDGRLPVIHISAKDNGALWLFSVQDNGIGVDPDYVRAIFAPFKRLHSDDQYEGTGIGLAICQRIIRVFGGSIWVESVQGKGSTFFFTIPKHTTLTESGQDEERSSD
ncbi:MAG: ATP-binding protein [Alphaproteobacteria bacterium]|nr:ATP-binding protein [Alphaproteobacteria bacterium]